MKQQYYTVLCYCILHYSNLMSVCYDYRIQALVHITCSHGLTYISSIFFYSAYNIINSHEYIQSIFIALIGLSSPSKILFLKFDFIFSTLFKKIIQFNIFFQDYQNDFFQSSPRYNPISVFHTLRTSYSTCIQFYIMYHIADKAFSSQIWFVT